MDPLGRWYDGVTGSRQRARALSAARLLGDRDFHKFFKDHARQGGAKDYFEHFTRFVTAWEAFVLDGAHDAAIQKLGAQYSSIGAAEQLRAPWFLLVDAYLRAVHTGGRNTRLGQGNAEFVFNRMRQFGEYFGFSFLISDWFKYTPEQVCDHARQALTEFEPITILPEVMKALYDSLWYRSNPSGRLQQQKVAEFVRNHMPLKAQIHLK